MRPGRHWLGFFALGLAACAAVPGSTGAGAPGPTLTGTRWQGVVDKSVDARGVPRLEFAGGGKLTGFTGCNRLSGTWRVDGSQVRFGAIAATKRMCAGIEGDIERRLLAVLNEQGHAVRDGPRLILIGPGGERFAFAPIE